MNFLLYACYLLSLCSGDFVSELNKRLVYDSEIIINEEYIKPKSEISLKDPPGTWLEVLRTRDICLFYKTPFKDKKGILKIANIKNSKCDEIQKSDFEYHNIDEISIDLRPEESSLKLMLQSGEDKKEIMVPLFNLRKKIKYQKYSSNIGGFRVNNLNIDETQITNVLREGQLCHGLNSNCNDVVMNNCEKCPKGFYEIVDYNCPQGGSKYCGSIDCGQKDMPACPRGYEILDTKLPSLCFDGSPAGYCAPGLKTYCNEDKILVCL